MYICRSAAKTRLISAMDFVNRLKPNHLQAFWYFASKINFTLIGTFGSLLWATAPTREEADFYKTRLREYRWTLSVSSKRAEFLDYAVQMLDASRNMLLNLADKPSAAEKVSTAGVPPAPNAAETAALQKRGSPSSMMDLSRLQQQSQQDIEMGGMDDAPLTRYPSTSSFSGFHNEQQFGEGDSTSAGQDDRTPITTPSVSIG
jgi:hypothetical protein